MNESNNPVRIAFIGECMIQLQGPLFGSLKQSWGGDTYNTAVYLRRLLPEEFEVHYLTALGDDALSEHLKQAWHAQGLDVGNIRTIADKRPGLYQISTDASGERSFHYWRNDAAAKYLFDQRNVDEVADLLMSFDQVYVSGISLAILTQEGRSVLLNALERYADHAGKVVFDNNYRPALWASLEECRQAYRRILAVADIALITEDDDQLLWQYTQSDEIFAAYQCPEVVIKRGSEACLLRVNGQRMAVPTQAVDNVVDTTAAGDSFAAGYLFGRLTSESPEQSVRYGHTLAGRVIRFPGAIIDESAMPHF